MKMGLECLSFEERLWELGPISFERAERDLINIYEYLKERAQRRIRAVLSRVQQQIKGQWTVMDVSETGSFSEHEEELLYSAGERVQEQIVQIICGVFPTGDGTVRIQSCAMCSGMSLPEQRRWTR